MKNKMMDRAGVGGGKEGGKALKVRGWANETGNKEGKME